MSLIGIENDLGIFNKLCGFGVKVKGQGQKVHKYI